MGSVGPGSAIRTLTLALVALLTTAACGPSVGVEDVATDTEAAASIAGIWEGAIDAGVELRLVMHLAVKDGELVATLDSPDQGASGIPVDTARFDGARFALAASSIGAEYEATLVNGELRGTWHQGLASIALSLRKVDEPSERPRPQTPQPPYPYTEETVTFTNEAGTAMLAGTLTLPAGDGPFPGAVLVSGSGPQDRDEMLFDHRPFKVIADHLTRNGVAVLRYDDRGFGESSGDFAAATTADFTDDAIAAVRTLAAREDVARVGIIGHSEGAIVADRAARLHGDVAWTVRLAGPAVSGRELLQAQNRAILEASGASAAFTAAADAFNVPLYALAASSLDEQTMLSEAREHISTMREALDETTRRQLNVPEDPAQVLAQIASPWFRYFVKHDPAEDLAVVDVPVLAIFGGKDLQVPAAQSAEPARALLRHEASAVEVYSNLNHLFQNATTGLPVEYAQIEETMDPAVLDAMLRFIQARR